MNSDSSIQEGLAGTGQALEPNEAPPMDPAKATPCPPRPRVWPALSIVPVTIVAMIAANVAVAASFAVFYAVGGVRDPSEIQKALFADLRFIVVTVLVNMAIIGLAAFGAGALSRERWTTRLGLTRPTAPLWSYPIIFVGSGFLWGIVMTLMPLFIKEPSDQLIQMSMMFALLGSTSPLLLIFLIAVLPPIMEELLLRGYVQRRVVRRWGAVIGILVASLAFGILHIDPQHAIGVIPLGIWCGYVAWRTASVFPAMLCHASNNGFAVAFLLMHPQFHAGEGVEEVPEEMAMTVWDVWPMWPFLGVTGACLVLSIIVLSRTARPKA